MARDAIRALLRSSGVSLQSISLKVDRTDRDREQWIRHFREHIPAYCTSLHDESFKGSRDFDEYGRGLIDICKASGTTPGTLYMYISVSKESPKTSLRTISEKPPAA